MPSSHQETIEVSTVKTKKKQQGKKPRIKLPRMVAPLSAGFYYGINTDTLTKSYDDQSRKKRTNLRESMAEALDEIRTIRKEMETMRREMQQMKRQFGDFEEEETEEQRRETEKQFSIAQRKKQREFDKIGLEIERWARQLLFEEKGEVNGWKEIDCKARALNRNDRTTAYLKWMKDSRGGNAEKEDEREYPCMKMYSTIDAPLEDVCKYLSQKDHMLDYNDLITQSRDVEELSPNAKICWGQTPQILIIKPRELVTYCQHRWLRDGTQVIVNQACEHKDARTEGRPRAYALRGANYIGRDPDDHSKTQICMLAHGKPGPDVPNWALRTAVKALAPIEPFRLFHRINENIIKALPELERKRSLEEAEVVSSSGRSRRPAGIAQLGYACFWPNGGGLIEKRSRDTNSAILPPMSQPESANTLYSDTTQECAPEIDGVSLETDAQTRSEKEDAVTANAVQNDDEGEVERTSN